MQPKHAQTQPGKSSYGNDVKLTDAESKILQAIKVHRRTDSCVSMKTVMTFVLVVLFFPVLW